MSFTITTPFSDEVRAAATQLAVAIRSSEPPHPSSIADELAVDTIMNALNIVTAQTVIGLETPFEQTHALAQLIGHLGGFIGGALAALPPSLQAACMTAFAEGLNTRMGVTKAVLCSAAMVTPPHQQETKH